MKDLFYAVSALSLATITACGAARHYTDPAQAHNERVLSATPSWYKERAAGKDEAIPAHVGYGAGSSMNQDIAEQQAKAGALADLGRVMSAYYKGASTTAQSQIGSALDGEAVSTFNRAATIATDWVDVSNATVGKFYYTTVDGAFYAWATVEFKVGEANERYLAQLRASKVAWQRFQGTKVQERMQKEVDDLRASKEKQKTNP